MTRQSLEKYQVLIYLAAILLGLAAGHTYPEMKPVLEHLLWPVLGLLLYCTFIQVSLSGLIYAFGDTRFITAALLGNFLLIPGIVLMIIHLLPPEPALLVGVALVLLVPCTDWFITFTQLGKGDTQRAIAFTPISLLFQIILLPGYLFLFFGRELTFSLATTELFIAFAGIIILPLILAYGTQRWANVFPPLQSRIASAGWLPVPLLALVIWMISASQARILVEATYLMWYAAAAFILFLLIAALLAKLLAIITKLPVHQGRVLAFSFGSRNSFVVLPIALALPESFEIAAPVVVLQSLIELAGMVIYLRLIPGVLFKNDSGKKE